MPSITGSDTRWAVLAILAGAIAAVLVYVLTSDVVRSVIPLLLAVAALRLVLRRRHAGRPPG